MKNKAFQQFYEKYFSQIYRFVILRVGDRAVAEDLVSEIFIKALRAFESYDEKISTSSWIFTIARNHLANHYRSAGREIAEENIEKLPIFGEDFVERAAVHQDVNVLLKTLSVLSADKQQLIRMKYLEELSYEEMGERLKKDKDTLKVATFRAMKELRNALKGRI